jgi:hypothetical protein
MISVSGLPDLSLMDSLVNLTVLGAVPGSRLTLKLAVQDDAQVTWQSQARFEISPEEGRMRLSRAQPESGTYERAHPMGLFWSMRPHPQTPGREGLVFQKRGLSPLEYRLEIEDEQGALLLERQFLRTLIDSDVSVEKLDASSGPGLAAEFYFKKGSDLKNGPLVLIFGGSGGGMDFSRRAASLLASRGIPSMALAYFAYPGRPPLLANIEIEYFEKALRWLKARAENENAKITVMGGSRGGELSLLLASLYPHEIHQVIARVPSHVVWAQGAPSWIHQGAPLDHVPMLALQEIQTEFEALRKKGGYIALTPLFEKAIRLMGQQCQEAAIAVEKFNGRILLISGEDDQTWPSSWFSDRVVERMQSHGKGDRVRHLKYPHAGHGIPLPYFPATAHDMLHPVEKTGFKNGGTDEGDALAAEDSWLQIRRFILD